MNYVRRLLSVYDLLPFAEPNMAGRGSRRDDNPQAKIIIRNYPMDTTERDLRIMFEKYGKIDDCEFVL